MTRVVLLMTLMTLALGCGRYGPPVRAEQARPVPEAPGEPPAGEPDTEADDEEEEAG